MKLINALEVLRCPVADTAPESNTFLACGFTPLHLQTFLSAELRALLPKHRVSVKTGLYGDLMGSIERLEPVALDSLAMVIEWGDLDPRLGVRTLGGWHPTDQANVMDSVALMAARLQRGLTEVSRRLPTIVCMPTLSLPPMFSTRPAEASFFETQLHHTVASLAKALCELSGVRIANAQILAESSPPGERYDMKSDLTTGFPYGLSHASALGKLLAELISGSPPKKGLITDLDDTLWSGILGEDGVQGISWHLDRHTHLHGIYQQFVASLAGAGVLIGVASKNDAALVEDAFTRSDLLLSKADIFPFEVHWSRKSESVQRVLQTWNVSADSVVFVDDNPMEIAEVKAAFPEMECILFPKSDYRGVWNLVKHLRDVFGKTHLTEDDALRLNSIRDAAAWQDVAAAAEGTLDEFLKTVDASIIFESVLRSGNARAFELVNKTNQFNLNGKRFNESAWRDLLDDPAAFVFSVSYKDKFGPLGTIAVIMGTTFGSKLSVNGWVMSCRAFSRRIEHSCLKYLFETFNADEIVFDYETTARNGPLQEFLAGLIGKPLESRVILSREQFSSKVPLLFHRVDGAVRV
jgi:FkbH-like protein